MTDISTIFRKVLDVVRGEQVYTTPDNTKGAEFTIRIITDDVIQIETTGGTLLNLGRANFEATLILAKLTDSLFL